jgi:hypothetical protein
MAYETLLYGMIDAGEIDSEVGLNVHHQRNLDAIAQLPESDDQPALIRSMFSVPGPNATFQSQVIHFGGSFEMLERNFHLWLEKFEEQLKKMYWYSVVLHLDSELLEGDYEYQWCVSEECLEERLFLPDPLPVNEWEFDGPPRKFDI